MENSKNIFDDRVKSDPNGVIKDLLEQTAKQGKTIFDLNKIVADLIKKLEKKLD